MGAGTTNRLTQTISVAVVLGMVASAAAADGGDTFSRMRALAATMRRVPLATPGVTPLAVGGGFAKTYGGVNSDEAFFNKQLGVDYLLSGMTFSFGPFGADSGLPWLLELDGSGTPILQQVWGTAQTEAGVVGFTSDGGYSVSLVAANTPGQEFLQLVRLNSSFTSVWQKQYGVGGEGLVSAVVLSDNSFLLEGSTATFSNSGVTFVVVVVKTDASGNILWQKQLSSPDAIALAFQQQADGSYLGVGTIAVGLNDIDVLLVKLDSNGNITWQKRYGGPLADEAFQVIPISGGYLIPGSTTSFGAGKSDMWLLELDGSGNVLKQETIGGAGDDVGFLLARAGGYLITGSTNSSGAGGRDGWLAFLDSNLNVTSSKTFGGSGDESLIAVADSAGGYLLQGSTNSFGGGGDDAWVIKTDGAGTPIWQNAYGGSADETAGVYRISGGGLILSGSTASWGAGKSDTFAAILDANGQLAGGLGASIGALDAAGEAATDCGLVHPTTVSPVNFPVTVASTSVTPVTTALAETNAAIPTSTITLSPITTLAVAADICGATAQLTATAGASATSGATPFSVNFTGSAAGGTPPYSYDWDFGDGSAHSGQQNPTHVYTSAGYDNVVLTVTDSKPTTATDTHLYINVTAGACSVTCQATVPGTGAVGVGVNFTSSASASGCLGSITYLWSFGDGQTSTEQNPTHVYASANNYTWTLVVTAGTGTCSKNGTILVSAAGTEQDWVPVGSHASGLNSSQYRSDLGLLNVGTTSKDVQINGFIGGKVYTKNVVVSAGEQLILTDVVGQLGASGSGAIQVISDPVKVTARTYNQVASTATCYANGTQGQDYLSATTGQGLSTGQSAFLAGLTENAAYRTNIGVTNTGGGNAIVTVFLYDAAGNSLGSYQVNLSAGEWQQVTQPFKNKATPSQTAMAAGYAKITVNAGSGILAYASLLDNITNDPTTINALAADSGTTVWVPVGSHASGLNSSQYRSNLGLLNTGRAGASVLIKGYIGASVLTKNVAVAAGAQVILTDVVGQLGANGSGAIEVISDQPLKVTARTYNQVASTATCYANGTQGQDYMSAKTSQALSAGQSAWLGGLIENAAYRTNIGVTNTGGGNATVTVYLYGAAGNPLGSYQVNLSAGEWQQVTQPFKNKATPSQTAMAAGYAKITVNAGSGILASASLLNNITNDPTTINAVQ